MTLEARFEVQRGGFALDVAFSVADGEVLGLIGPNGSGKSTLLAAVAGLLPIASGEIVVDGAVVARRGVRYRSADAHGSRRTPRSPDAVSLAPERRDVGLLGQDPLLFPHLSALENVAFGPRARGTTAGEARDAAARWLADVGLSGFERRHPAELSGGQQQRVAIARALATEPAVLLLDEPMAALDVTTAAAIRDLLAERLGSARIPAVLVTHDATDALALADRVAILDRGRLTASGPTADVLGASAAGFATAFAGPELRAAVVASDGSVRVPTGLAPGERVMVSVARPRERGGE